MSFSHDLSPIETYLPHRGRMLLLDRLLDAEPGHARAAVSIRPDSAFCQNGQVPAYVGIEYMAQTIGALVGWEARQQGHAIKIGFLVSVRHFSSTVHGFDTGTQLIIETRTDWRDEQGTAVADCAIFHPGQVRLASARLMVFQPADAQAYLQNTPADT